MSPLAIAAGLVAWLVLRDDGGSSNARSPGRCDRDEARGHRDTGPVCRASDLLARTEARHDLRGHAGRERQDLRALPAVGCGRRLCTSRTSRWPRIRSRARTRSSGSRRAPRARSPRGSRAEVSRCSTARLPAERPHRLPARGLPGRGLRPDAGARDAARVGGAAHEHRQRRGERPPAGSARSPRPRRAQTSGAFAQRVGHPIYWAGPKPGYTYELSTHVERERVHPLPAGRREGRRPEGALPDGCHVPVSGRLRRGRRRPRHRGRRRHDQARARRDRRRRRRVPEEHPHRLSGSRATRSRSTTRRRAPAASSSPPARSRRSRSPGPDRRRSCCWPGSSFRSSSRCSRSAAACSSSARPGSSLPGALLAPARARAADRRGRPRHHARGDRPARGSARDRARDRRLRARGRARCGSTPGRSARRSPSSPSTPRRSSSPAQATFAGYITLDDTSTWLALTDG